MLETPAVGLHGPACRDLVLTVIESSADKCYSFMDDSYKRFVDALEKKQFCLPSVLLKEIQSTTEDILTDCDFRKQVVNDLPAEESFLPAVINTFFVEFIFKLGSHILSFIKKCVVDRYPPSMSPEVAIDDQERQLIHYMSGSTIRAFLKKARSLKGNPVWCRIFNAITKCILEGGVVVSAADTDKYWTEFCNRGGLLSVGKDFHEFMVSVVKLLYAAEKPDGSIYHEEVQEVLLNSPARTLWDKMIGSVLPENESISFMRGVVRSFTSSYGNGVSNKHRNDVMKKPKNSVPLRKRLGAKSA